MAATVGIGFLSSWLGIGGGILLVPVFTLLLKLPIHQAVALSLCCVMATSITSTARYLPTGLIDLRLVLTLELPTIIGSYLSGRVAGMFSEDLIAGIFAALLITSAILMIANRSHSGVRPVDEAKRLPPALGASFFAGGLVGLLGVGGGIVKVPIIQLIMGRPVKQATAMSSMMIGISACVGVIPYLTRSEVPLEQVPLATLGTVAGAWLGARIFHKVESIYVKILFAAVLLYTAVTMILRVVR